MLAVSRFSIPLPKGTYAPIEQYATTYHGVLSGLSVDPQTGHLSLGWQVLAPPFDFDLGSVGKGPSNGWAFWTSYNTERATGKLEVTSTQKDRDYIAAVNWKAAQAAVKSGKFKILDGAKIIDPPTCPVSSTSFPARRARTAWMSLRTASTSWSRKTNGITTVFNFEKLQKAIQDKNFTGNEDGIPVVNYDAVKEAEVNVGLGPLHTQFDDQGYAYTSLFVESAIAKWKLGTWEVVDKIPVSYNIGHLAVPGGDTVHPEG